MDTKYEPLAGFLRSASGDRIPVTFGEIEKALGFRLPASKRYPAWWSNNPSNNPMTRVWLKAGFVTEQVDIGRERLTFRRARRSGHATTQSDVPDRATTARLRERLVGTARFAPDVDPAEPTGEDWQAQQ